ncbi:MAG: ATP-binding protein [Euryarchaeota archaeon]|nr:ATP-binding protein [Euryarchaeota archaeon]
MVKISEIINQNPWWKYGKEFTPYDRHLPKAKESLIFFDRREFRTSKENIYVMRGCRQIGKTTYLKEWINKLISKGFNPKRILYLSLDFFTSRREMRNAINYFLDTNREAEELHMFLDEITTIKDWNLELKYLWDSGITRRAKIITTGSSGMALRKKGELLPGRGLERNEYYLKPLSFREFVLQTVNYIQSHAKTREFQKGLRRLKAALEKVSIDMKSDVNEMYGVVNTIIPFKKELEYLFRIYLMTGGFPAVINAYLKKAFAGKRELLDYSLAETLVRNVLGDVIKQGRQETFARQILKEIIDKYGTRYSFSKLAREIEITHVTTIDYLDLLEESFILTVLHAYDFNKKDIKFKGEKKVYFQDPFIFCALESSLSGRDVNDVVTKNLEDEESLSKIVEGIVCSHLALNQEVPTMREVRTFLWFYYDSRGREIDSVLRLNKSFVGVETKYRSNVSFRDALKIPQIKRYIILSKEDVGLEKDILIAPVETFLSLLNKSSNNL